MGTGILKVHGRRDLKKWYLNDGTTVSSWSYTRDDSRSTLDMFPDPNAETTSREQLISGGTRSPVELRELAGVEGYFADQINEVLRKSQSLNVATTIERIPRPLHHRD